MRRGDRGPAVGALQQGLNNWFRAYRQTSAQLLTVDNDFGLRTEQAVNYFRSVYNLPQNGEADDTVHIMLGLLPPSLQQQQQQQSVAQTAANYAAMSPALIPFAVAMGAGFTQIAGAYGRFSSPTGVLYTAVTSESGEQFLRNTGELVSDAARASATSFFQSLGISLPVALVIGGLALAIILKK